ncbi:MAG: septum formation initiator [Alphaproteobacteria bacterium]|nr:septum formation initiator [Alphaproteobacteria bacterium]
MPARKSAAAVALAAATMLALTPAALGEDASSAGADSAAGRTTATTDRPARVETRHTIQLPQHSLDYRAIAEMLRLHDAKGNDAASMFTVSYLAEPKPGEARPVAFFFNGGPGAASVFLHLGAVGPRVVQNTPTGAVPDPPVRLVDNPSTWLDFTDLVFVDPVGTGFSRGEGKDDNPGKQFWNVHGDIESLDATVRLWLTRHQRWASPVYLVGESYGGFRVGAMAKSLARDEGIVPSGVVMISPALDTALLNPDAASLVAASIDLPTFAASAAEFSGAKDFDARPVERFALSDYLVGLAGIKGVPSPGDPFIAKVAATIGLPEEVVRRERGWVGKDVFAHELRRPQKEVLSLYDATVTRPAPGNPWDHAAGDPVLDGAVAAFTQAFNIYAPAELSYRTELPYRVLPSNVNHQWSFDGAREGQDGLGMALSGLQTALLEHPTTKVLIVSGRYDLVTPYLGARWLIDQLSIPAETRDAIQLKVYPGGHMMYLLPFARDALGADAKAMFEGALSR